MRPMIGRDSRSRVRRISVSAGLWEMILHQGTGASEIAENALPADAQIVGCQWEWPDSVVLILQSEEWDPVPEAGVVPYIIGPSFRTKS